MFTPSGVVRSPFYKRKRNMSVVNFTNRIIRGTSKQNLDYEQSMALNLTEGKSVQIIAGDVMRQIERASSRDDVIVLALPLWLTVEVEYLLAKHKLVVQVFYHLEGTLVPSPLFEKYDSLISEKSILQNICLEIEDDNKVESIA